MLTPTVATRISWLYAAGNTPATNLARGVPHGLDADVLSLGCGDLRNILFTSYVQKGLPTRKLDITCCDFDEKIIGRNIILLTLILDDAEEVTQESLWDIYYHMYLEDPTAGVVLQQAQKLVPMLDSLNAWKASPYHSSLRICDEDTLHDIQKVCRRIVHAAEKRNHKETLTSFSQSLQISKDCIGGSGTIVTGLRSAAPLSLKSQNELPENFKQYWSKGTVMIEEKAPRVPNPMFAGLVSKTEILHYGTDPLLGYHLATAFAHLSEHSPLKPEEKAEKYKVTAAAKAQFFEWVKAFKSLCKKHVVLRFVVSDVFAFCHTLQFAAASGQVSADWYRRLWDARTLRLDEETYGTKGDGSMTFDVIDTSNLSDHFGALNIAVSTAALLKAKPWATIYTEQLIKRDNSEQQAFDMLLCGPSSTVSLLLGLTSLQYWTNAKSESHVDEIFLGLLGKSSGSNATQLHGRLAWKRDDQFTSGGAGRPKLHIEAKAAAQAIFQIYLRMFKLEKLPTNRASIEELLKVTSTYCHFHRGSFVALLKLIKSRVKTDWFAMFTALLNSISMERTLVLASNQMQDLCIQLHISGLHTEPWILDQVNTTPGEGLFKGWSNVPPAVAVTVAIPRTAFDRLYSDSKQRRMAAPTLVGSLRASFTASSQWHNMFGDVHIVFGKISKHHSENGDVVVSVEEDKLGWSGSSHLIATFTVPTAGLLVEPKTALVGLCVPPTGQNSVIYGPILGMSMTVFETKISDESKIFISKHMPGQTANKTVCRGVKPFEDEVGKTNGEGPTKFLAQISPAEGRITTLTGHIDISSEKGRGLLRDKVPIELRQQSPFIIDIVFDSNKLICPLSFPVPVTKVGSKTRIARTSGYIEVIAPLADPTTSEILADFISPTALTPQGLPVALNTSHLNLDNLPILDLSKKVDMRWLTTLTSLQFSAREKRLREVADSNGISNDPRVNFKESLFTMYMLASGLQGGQTGMFAITHPEQGGIHMLIFVSAVRLDGDTASVVLDAAVIPFTTRLIESAKMEAFLILIRTLECCTLRVNDAELLLWKKVLPSMAERCRTWSHLSTCEYKRKNATAPISLELGEKVLCSCGNGRLPDDFVTVPEWETAARNAVRIAISPTYAVPFVEDVVDKSMLEVKGPLADVPRCRNCAKKEEEDGPKLKKCKRCQKAKYCSAECQKADWKKHRMECEEP